MRDIYSTNEQFVAAVFITSTPFAKQHFFFSISILSFFDTKPTTQAAAAALLYTIDEPTTSANSIVGHRAAENIL